MNTEKASHWIAIVANLSVLVGIYFLIAEIQTNNESNTIGIWQTYSTNNVQIYSTLASDEFSSLLEKASTGESLDSTENRQLFYVANLFQTQSNYIRRLYDRGIASNEELIQVYNGYRGFAQIPAVRDIVMARSEETKQLVLEDGGVEKYIQESNR
ncbi:MAG: hypothetical protein COA96_14265 [SAR86 cluster bacterium]|uniref:Uncharacterized protein n=1 Tax=SAR86 cluster bacterium TaxID=2030880 RepID=A0A2A5ATM9_9GAMM|nr:MAG: hypothetical protein COA96_14265 [SAR86 cluster bacterium]